jgi:hypothetical protein
MLNKLTVKLLVMFILGLYACSDTAKVNEEKSKGKNDSLLTFQQDANVLKDTSCCISDDSACEDSDKKCCTSDKANDTKTQNSKSVKLVVYAFHGTRQCSTCKNMKSNTKFTLDKYFSSQLKSGEIQYFVIDVDDPVNEAIAEKFEATGTALMVNRIKDGKDNISDWSDFAFDKANESEAYIPSLKSMIEMELKK